MKLRRTKGPVIQSVADTAFMVAAHRARESTRPDALFRDPLAGKLAGALGPEIVASLPRATVVGWSIAIRTVVIDALIEKAIARGADTVINLGAGLDTRPYRMALPPALRWIEVDYPKTIDLKESQLASEKPRCALERVRLDLADLAARRRLFADIDGRSKQALVLTEGVVPYLSVADVALLADDLREMKAVRAWIVDYFSPQTMQYRARAGRHFKNAPFKFAPADWFAFFAQHGWAPSEKRFLVDEGERLGRPLPLPRLVRAWLRVVRPFTSSKQRTAFRHFAGYILLERTA